MSAARAFPSLFRGLARHVTVTETRDDNHVEVASSPPEVEEQEDEQLEDGDIISLDPAHPVEPELLIEEILRTRYCPPGSVFLVESLDTRIPIPVAKGDGHGRYRAVRAILGDGELCIQALLAPDTHWLVDARHVREGSYVRVDEFELGWVDIDGEDSDGGSRYGAGPGKKKGGQRDRMAYLVVKEMVAVGWNTAYLEIIRAEAEAEGAEGSPDAEMEDLPIPDSSQSSAIPESPIDELPARSVVNPDLPKQEAVPDTARPAKQPSMPRGNSMSLSEKDLETLDYISDSDEAFEELAVSIDQAVERRVQFSATPDVQQHRRITSQQTNITTAATTNTPQQRHGPQPQRATHTPINPSSSKTPMPKSSTKKQPAWAATDPTQPLKLTPLKSIPNLPYKQNWVVNVLAVVVSLSDVEPCNLAPTYAQRTARLADPSTSKQVRLDVFLDPDQFCPAVGGVVLLVGVKNHAFDGGCLKKYASDKPKHAGGKWWVEEPDVGALGWCEEEVELLREWWDG